MAHDVDIEIKSADGKIIAIDQIALPEEIAVDDLFVTITTTELKEERNPLHPRALRLSDLRVGMNIRINHEYSNDRSYSAIVVGEPTTNEYGSTVIPLVRLGDKSGHVMGYPEDMGLTPYQEGCQPWWNHAWYTTAE